MPSSGKSGENSAHDNLYGGRSLDHYSVHVEGGVIGRIRFDKSRRNLRIFPTPTSNVRTSFRSQCMGILTNVDHISSLGCTTADEMA